MALLRALLPLLAATALMRCSQPESLGHADVNLRDCADCRAAPRHYQVQAFFDSQVSRHAPGGFYAYFELERPDGARGVLELDIPTNAASDAPLTTEDASYRELRDGRVVFEAKTVQGSVQLPRSMMWEDAARCDCDDALFELTFRAGDEARELSYGHLSRDEAVCGARLPARTDPGLAVQVLDCSAAIAPPVSSAPSAPDTSTVRTPPPARSTSTSHSCAYADCYQDDRDYTAVEAGCGGSSYYQDDGCGSGSSSDAQGGGCSDSSSSSSSEGCSSGSDSDQHKSSGCEGDTSDSPSSCSVARPARGAALRSFMGTGLPLTLVCLWQALRAARARRRARSAAPASSRR